MWSTLSKFLGLTRKEEGTSTDEGATGTEESVAVSPQREWREFDGLVTSLHSSYGLIDNEVYFTHDVVTDGVMPKVGDTVHVKASRKHQVGGWKAECVSRVNANRAWDNDWNGDEDEDEEDGTDEDVGGAETEESRERLERARRLREKRAIERAALAELVADKMDISITQFLDFGQLEVGKTKSLKMEIKNNGTISQTLCGWTFKSQSVTSQFELSPIRLLSIDLKQSSRKAQETLPMILEPGKAAVVTVYCNAQYLGLDQQVVVFEFEGFAIGRKIEVTVLDLTQLELQPVVPYKKSQAAGRYQQTKEAWIVPGQRPTWGNSGAKLPKRLPQYPVPEYVRKCILEQRDVTTVLPVLLKSLSPENYAARFSGLLFLEEIQQEIDIREFDLDRVSMHVVGEFLALRIPGLAEGRPSLLIGDRAILSEPEESILAPSYEGIVHEVLKDEVHLKFCEDFHNSHNGKEYNVRFVFSRTNFRRCHTAADYVSKLRYNILFPKSLDVKMSQMHSTTGGVGSQVAMATVVKVGPVTGIKRCPARPRTKEIYASHVFFNDMLNSRQRSAVFRVLQGQGRPTPYIIFGPPGTGKTVTVVECILQIFYHLHNGCILACTPSNSAADLLAERLHQSGLVHVSDMVRVNAFQRGHENVVESVKPYCADVDDLDAIRSKRIVLCTCSTAGMFYGMDLPSCHFSHVFVDEAGQATEPECMIPIGLVAGGDGQIVLAGDPLQLGPVLRSNLAKDFGLQISYLERLSQLPLYTRDASKFVSHGSYDPLLVTKLVENYRSHPALLNLSSEIFYDGELVIAADKFLVECLCGWEHLPNKDSFPVLFHGIRGEDLREGNSPSWFNPQEAIQVMKYLQSVVHNEKYRLTYDDVGIITPYRKQVEKIRLLIDRLGMEKVKVGSVEEFQGQERLIMIISTVRSTESLLSVDLRYTLGFLSNPKRFNVAITRAHALLIIVGNPHVLSQDFYWCKLLQYCVANNAYVGCDLPEIGHLKSRTNPKRFSDGTGSSSEEGETALQQKKEEESPTSALSQADDIISVTGNVSVSEDCSAALKVFSQELSSFSLVPSTNQDSNETKELGVSMKQGGGSFLPRTYKSGSAFGRIFSTKRVIEGSDAVREDDAARKSLLVNDAKPCDTIRGGSINIFPVCPDSVGDALHVDEPMRVDSVSNAEEQPSGGIVITDPNPEEMETHNVVDIDRKTETYRNSEEFSTEHQGCVETSASEKPESEVESLIESKGQSYSDNSGRILSKFNDCAESIKLTVDVDVTGDSPMIRCDENVVKYVTGRGDGVLRPTVEQTDNAELQSSRSPAYDETVRTDAADVVRCEGEGEAKESAIELEVTECKPHFADEGILEKEQGISRAVYMLQNRDITRGTEGFQPFASHASDYIGDSVRSVKLYLPNNEELCTDQESLGGVIPSSELAKVFTNRGTVDSSALNYCAEAGKQLHLSATDFSGNDCENTERPRLTDRDDLKSFESSFGTPRKDLPVTEPAERLEGVSRHDKPDFVGRSPFDLVVLDNDLESAIADMSLDVCVPESISSTLTSCDDDMFDYERFTGMRISDDTSEICALFEKPVGYDNRPEKNPAVGVFCDGSYLSEDSVIPLPVTRAETSETNVVNGDRENLDDIVFEETVEVLYPDSDFIDVDEMISITQIYHSGSEETGKSPHLSPEEISRERKVPEAQLDMSNMESRGSKNSSPPDCNASLRKSPTEDGAPIPSDTPVNIVDRAEATVTICSSDSYEAGDVRQRSFEDGTSNTDVTGVPVKGSVSEPSLGISVSHALNSLPVKSASQTTTIEQRTETEKNPAYGQMNRGGGFSSQRRRGGFDRGATHSSKPFDRQGRGRTEDSGFNRRSFLDTRRSAGMESIDSLANEQESQLELEKKIIHQMEYYFGDFNLMRDGFLQEQIARDIDGWVDLSVIVTFNRMKTLTTDFKVICDALRKSPSGVVEVTDDNTKVRRSIQKPLNNDMDSWIKDLKTRAAVIKNYPSSETIDNMQSFFETYGGVAHIERAISKRSYHRGSGSGRPSFELVDLVIFLSEEGLKNLAKRRYTTLTRMGLTASFTDELSDQCVDYFYQRRVLGVPRQSLQPVGSSLSLGDAGIQREPRESADSSKFQQNRNRPYQSSSLQNQKFLRQATSPSQPSSSNGEHGMRTGVSDDGGITEKSSDKVTEGAAVCPEDNPEMTIRPLMEIDAGPTYQRHSTGGHRTTYRRSSRQQFQNRSYSDSSDAAYQKTFENKAWTEPRITRQQPQSPRNDLDHSGEGKFDIDKLLSNVDNMSFSRRQCLSPSEPSPDSLALDSSNRVDMTTGKSGVSKQGAIAEPFAEIPSPQTMNTSSRRSRKVKCFDPEFSFELPPSDSAVYDRPAAENVPLVASTAEADSFPHPEPFVSSSPPRNIPEMNLIGLTTGTDWNSATGGRLQPQEVNANERVSSWMNQNLESQVNDETLSYSLLSDQRDDDIIIESSCEEDLEIEISDDDTKGGWE